MIDKTYKGDFYNGALTEIKSELNMSLPPGKSWIGSTDGLGLIGNPTGIYNAHQTPYTFPAYIEITFSNKYIYPTHYFLEGRRLNNEAQLKSWNFEGRTLSGEWKILHSQVDKPFSQNETRLFPLKIRDVFTGFRVNMTDTSSTNNWALCLGQIEVFGNIFYNIPIIYGINIISPVCHFIFSQQYHSFFIFLLFLNSFS